MARLSRGNGISATLPCFIVGETSNSWSRGVIATEPRPVELRELRRQRRHGVDEPYFLDDRARQVFVAGKMPQFVLWIEQRQRDEVECVGIPQAGDDPVEELAQRMRSQQFDLAGLRLAQQQLVARHFFRERPQALAQFFFRGRVGIARAHIHARRSATDRRSSRYSRPRRMSVGERIEILGDDRGPQPLDRLRQRLERLRSVVVEALDLEVQLRAFLRHERRDVELRIERGGRQLREARRGFTAVGQRREEGDIQRVRQARARRR